MCKTEKEAIEFAEKEELEGLSHREAIEWETSKAALAPFQKYLDKGAKTDAV